MLDFTFANVFKILNDHLQLPNREDVLQWIKDDREQEQEDKETTDNDNGNISFETEMSNVNNDKIINKKGSDQSEEVSKDDLVTIQQRLDNLIQSVVDDVVNKSVGAKKWRKQCNSAEDWLRWEKENDPVLHECSRVDKSKKGCARKCRDNFTEKTNGNLRTLLGLSKGFSKVPVDFIHGRYSYSSSAKKENLRKKGEKSQLNFSFRKGRTWKSSSLPKNVSRNSWSNRRQLYKMFYQRP